MDVTFRPKGAGWRGKGRPPRQVPEALQQLVRETYDRQAEAAIPAAGHPTKEVRQMESLIRLAAQQLGWVARVQHDDKEIRFYVEDKPSE